MADRGMGKGGKVSGSEFRVHPDSFGDRVQSIKLPANFSGFVSLTFTGIGLQVKYF